jgi:hypothetical protein
VKGAATKGAAEVVCVLPKFGPAGMFSGFSLTDLFREEPRFELKF